MGPTFLYGDSDTPPHLVAFYDHAGDTEVHILDLTPGPSRGDKIKKKKEKALEKELVNEDDYVDNIESMEQLSPINSELEHLNTNITSGEQTLFSQSTIVGDDGDETVMGGIQNTRTAYFPNSSQRIGILF